ncbi:hypothetical protein, partial [Escherichia coli]|uniref:hypothetical protein n=1 Tax=Escherichia coli TaxID=562 RepID=UPI00320DDE0C
ALRAKSQRLGAMVSTDLSQGFCLLHPVSLWSPDNFFYQRLYLFFICCDRVFLNVTGIMFQFFITPQEALPDNRTALSDYSF